jgi:hypothetical protein
MSNAEALWRRENPIIRNSLLNIQYSFGAHGKFIFFELPITEELAEYLPRIEFPLR